MPMSRSLGSTSFFSKIPEQGFPEASIFVVCFLGDLAK